MYENRISRNTKNSQPKFFIPHKDIAFEPRTAYIERVCEILLEGRFGPDAFCDPSDVIIHPGDSQELEPELSYDWLETMPDRLMPFRVFISQGRARHKELVEAILCPKAQSAVLIAAPIVRNSAATLTPNQGRGSP